MPLRDILRLPGIGVILFVGVTVVSAQDLIVVYLPFLGAERGMAVEVVGWLLAARAVASVLSRFLFARLHALMGHWRLMMASVLASAISYAAVALPLPVPVMLAVVAVAGFALGIAITATIAALLNLATPETRGTANSLRIMGNRARPAGDPVLRRPRGRRDRRRRHFHDHRLEPCGLDRRDGDAAAEAD